jgi:hypothetical protein
MCCIVAAGLHAVCPGERKFEFRASLLALAHALGFEIHFRFKGSKRAQLSSDLAMIQHETTQP